MCSDAPLGGLALALISKQQHFPWRVKENLCFESHFDLEASQLLGTAEAVSLLLLFLRDLGLLF